MKLQGSHRHNRSPNPHCAFQRRFDPPALPAPYCARPAVQVELQFFT